LGNKAEKMHTYKFVPCDTYKQTKSIMLTQKNFIFGQMFEDFAVPIEKNNTLRNECKWQELCLSIKTGKNFYIISIQDAA